MAKALTPEIVRDRVKALRFIHKNNPGDAEVFHAREDELHLAVLRKIASMAGPKEDLLEDAVALAREAIKTAKIPSKRWYA